MKQEDKNKNFSVKKLLTTASAFAVIASAASDAAAHGYTTVDANSVNLIEGRGVNHRIQRRGGMAPSNVNWKSEHSFSFNHDDVELNLGGEVEDGNGNMVLTPGSIAAIDLGGRTAHEADGSERNLRINVRGRTAIGAVVNTGHDDGSGAAQNTDKKADLVVADGAENILVLEMPAGATGKDKDDHDVRDLDYTAVETVILADGSRLEASAAGLVAAINDVSAENALVTVSDNAQLTVNDITGDDARAEVSGDAQLTVNDIDGERARVSASGNAQLTVNDITGANARAEVSGTARLNVRNLSGELEIKNQGKAKISGESASVKLSSADAEVEFTGDNDNSGEVLVDGDAQGVVQVEGARRFSNIGAAGNRLAEVNFTAAGSSVTNNLHAAAVNVAGATNLGGTVRVDALNLNGAAASVNLPDNAVANTVTTQGNNEGTLEVGANVRIQSIGFSDDGAPANNLRLAQVDLAAGSSVTNNLHAAAVNVAGATNLGGTVRVDALNLDGAAADVTLNDDTDANGTNVRTSTNNQGVLHLGERVTVQSIGSSDADPANNRRLAQVDLANGSSVTHELHAQTVNVNGATNLGGTVRVENLHLNDAAADVTLADGAAVNNNMQVQTTANNQGRLRVGANITIDDIGAVGNRLAQVDLAADSRVENGLHAQTVNVNGNATLGGQVQSDDFTIHGDHQLTLADGAQVDAHIKTENNEEGLVAFDGNARVSQNLGGVPAAAPGGAVPGAAPVLHSLKNVYITRRAGVSEGTEVVFAGREIYSKEVRIDNRSTFKLDNDVKIEADNTYLHDATIDLVSHRLTHNGDITFENGGTNTLKFALSGDEDALNGGTMVVNGRVTFAGDSTLILTPTDTGINKKPGSHRYTLIDATNIDLNGRDISDVISYSPGVFYKWKVELAGGNSLNLLTQDISLAYLKNKIKGDEKNLAKVASATDGVALKLKDLWNAIAAAEENGSVKAGTLQEAHNRVINGHTGASDNAANNVSGAETVVGARTFSLRALPAVRTTASAGHVTGIAAGDDADQYGVWVNPFYAHLAQGARGEAAGYKSQSYGSSFGMDTKVNEDATLGLAVTLSATNTKHKDFKDGDKTKVKSAMVSVYNMYDFAENWFTSGSATIGASKVHNYAKKLVSATDYRTAEAKYTIKAYGIKQMVGYNYGIESATFTPMLGLRFARVDAVKYQETGFSTNASISANAVNRLETIAGISVTGAPYQLESASITPEAHAFVDYNLLGKKQKTTVKFGSTEFESINNPQRLSANVGVGLRLGHDEFEYEATYDLQLAKKRVGHQGALKLRMNF